MLTTSFPCYDGDMAGIFIYEQAKKMVEKGMDVSVVAPHDFETKGYEIREGIKIHRFQYGIFNNGTFAELSAILKDILSQEGLLEDVLS